MVARSAEVARHLAGEHRPPELRFAPPPGGAWQLPFESLRQTFNDFARGAPLFELELVATPAVMLFGNTDQWQRRQANRQVAV